MCAKITVSPRRGAIARGTLAALAILLSMGTFAHASERIVAIADEGPLTGRKIFDRLLDLPTQQWTAGRAVLTGHVIVDFNTNRRVLVERAYQGEDPGYAKDRGLFVGQRGVFEGGATAALSFEQIGAAIRQDGWTPPPGPRTYPLLDDPCVSRDGRWIAFVHGRPESDGRDLWVYEADSHRFTKISKGDHYDELPAWSPDNTRLAFYRTEPRVGHAWGTGETTHPAYALWVWDRRTSQAKEVAPPGQYADAGRRALVWSPDGTRVLHQWASDQSKEALGIYLVGVNTGEIRRLSQEAGQREGPVTAYSFSPDGRKVLYLMRGQLFMVGADGSGRVPILAGRRFDLAKWNSDGSRIFLLEVRGNDWGWSLTRPDGSDLQPIVPPPGYRIVDVFTYME